MENDNESRISDVRHAYESREKQRVCIDSEILRSRGSIIERSDLSSLKRINLPIPQKSTIDSGFLEIRNLISREQTTIRSLISIHFVLRTILSYLLWLKSLHLQRVDKSCLSRWASDYHFSEGYRISGNLGNSKSDHPWTDHGSIFNKFYLNIRTVC